MLSGTPSTSRLGVRQLLDQPDRVIAHVAEDAGRHRRQLLGQRDPAFGEQRPECVERAAGHRLEAVGMRRARPG